MKQTTTRLTLFGEERVTVPPKHKVNGYAAEPGTGPDGETCGTCAHSRRVNTGSSKRWPKCEMMRDHWTRGPGSDIRFSSPACRFWKGDSDE